MYTRVMHRHLHRPLHTLHLTIQRGQGLCRTVACLIMLALQVGAQPQFTPVRVYVDRSTTEARAAAIGNGTEIYVSPDLLGLLGRRYHLDKRQECVIVEEGGGEIAIARPGGRAMLPLSSLVPVLRLTVRSESGACHLYTRPELVPPPPTEPKPVNTPPTPPTVTVQAPTPAALPGGPPARPTPPPSQPSTSADTPKSAKPAAQPTAPPPAVPTTTKQPTQPTPRATVPLSTKPPSQVSQPQALPPPHTTQPVTAASPPRTAGPAQQPPARVEGSLQVAQPVDQPSSHSGVPGTGTASAAPAERAPNAGPAAPGGPVSGATGQRPLPPTQLRIQSIAFQQVDERRARVVITSAGLPDISSDFLRSPYRLRLTMGRARLDSPGPVPPVSSPLVSRMEISEDRAAGTVSVTLTLSRMVSYRVESSSQQGMVVALALPAPTPRSIRDALIVIDPGHGGSDSTGCSDASDGVRIYEKNLTLAVARRVQQILAEAGATVIMTRSTDIAIPVGDRPIIANENGADVFVSIHIDDTGESPNRASASGSTAYFHRNDPTSRALAQSIIDRLCGYCDTHNRGARSDGTLYSIGLGVLRGSKVPATLLELGFIGNRSDREKILTAEFQQMVAHAITDGITAFLEGVLPDAPVNQRTVEP